MTATAPSPRPPVIRPLSHTQLRGLRARGIHSVGDALEEALAAAEAEGAQRPQQAKPELRWSLRDDKNMQWKTRNFGIIAVELQKHTIGATTERETLSYAQIDVKNQPNWLTLRIIQQLSPGTMLFVAKSNGDESAFDQFALTNLTGVEIPHLMVKLEWRDGKPQILRHEGQKGYCNIVLLDSEGTFVQLEIAVTTRNGRFWLTFQEVFAGQVARTTEASAEKHQLTTLEVNGHYGTVAPLYPECSQTDFLATAGMVHEVVIEAIKRGRSKPLCECKPIKWVEPQDWFPAIMADNGWAPATVLWFNASLGQGFVRCPDGKTCHVHFSKILDESGAPVGSKGQFPFLHPMTSAAIKWAQQPEDKRSATAIRVI